MGDGFKHVVCRSFVTGVLAMLAACSGGGGGDGGNGATTASVSGRITFDRVPVGSNGLNFNATTQAPARQIVVEAIAASNSTVLASTTTNASGDYTVTVPANTSLFIRAKAQMTQSGSGATWNFRVLDNTFGNALYVLDGSSFNSGTSATTRNLNAPSGWTGSAYGSTRAAAPFAILDTVFQAKELLLSAQADLDFAALDLYWSATNRASNNFCPSTGLIGTTSFVVAGTGDTDDCTTPQPIASGIYVLGETSDTDEFDQHVVAHEFGHYVEAVFSRSDSIGGEHGSFNQALDKRVAFGEGWGNAFSGMVLNNSVYRDSFGTSSAPGQFDMENNAVGINGWFSEASAGQILWDLFDAGAESGVENVQIPFATIFAALTGEQRSTLALTSIFSFADALIALAPAELNAIDSLLTFEGVNGTDEFGTGETNFNSEATLQGSVYASVVPGATQSVCTTGQAGVYNKLNNRRFVRLDLSQQPTSTRTITVTGAASNAVLLSQASSDPDVILWRQGEVLAVGFGTGLTEQLSARQFTPGVYIIEVFDAEFGSPDGSTAAQPRCMNVSVN